MTLGLKLSVGNLEVKMLDVGYGGGCQESVNPGCKYLSNDFIASLEAERCHARNDGLFGWLAQHLKQQIPMNGLLCIH